MKKNGIIKTIKLRCDNKLHSISLNSKGQLIFHNHPNGFHCEKTYEALGGNPSACRKLLEEWREEIKFYHPTIKLFKSFDKEFKNCQEIRKERSFLRNTIVDRLSDEEERKVLNESFLVRAALTKVLKQCANSFFSQCEKVDVDSKCAAFYHSPRLHFSYDNSEKDTSFFAAKTHIKVKVAGLGYDWYENVYKKGWAILEDHLVLKYGVDDGHPYVMATPILKGIMSSNEIQAKMLYKEIVFEDGFPIFVNGK